MQAANPVARYFPLSIISGVDVIFITGAGGTLGYCVIIYV